MIKDIKITRTRNIIYLSWLLSSDMLDQLLFSLWNIHGMKEIITRKVFCYCLFLKITYHSCLCCCYLFILCKVISELTKCKNIFINHNSQLRSTQIKRITIAESDELLLLLFVFKLICHPYGQGYLQKTFRFNIN